MRAAKALHGGIGLPARFQQVMDTALAVPGMDGRVIAAPRAALRISRERGQ